MRPLHDEFHVMLGQQVGDHRGVWGRGRVLHRVLDEPVVTAPGRRPAAQLHGRLGSELQLQHFAEQVVVAVPLATRVERDQKHVRPVELGEAPLESSRPSTASQSAAREAAEH